MRQRDEQVLRWGSAVLVGFLVIGTALVLASWLFGPQPHATSGAAPRPAAASASATPTVLAPSTPAATAASTRASATPAALTGPQMTAFLRRYLAAAASNPADSWAMLTPQFQAESHGYAAYAAFWGPISAATPSSVFAEPADQRIGYTVSYLYADGRRSVDSTRLELVRRDGRILIAGEG